MTFINYRTSLQILLCWVLYQPYVSCNTQIEKLTKHQSTASNYLKCMSCNQNPRDILLPALQELSSSSSPPELITVLSYDRDFLDFPQDFNTTGCITNCQGFVLHMSLCFSNTFYSIAWNSVRSHPESMTLIFFVNCCPPCCLYDNYFCKVQLGFCLFILR